MSQAIAVAMAIVGTSPEELGRDEGTQARWRWRSRRGSWRRRVAGPEELCWRRHGARVGVRKRTVAQDIAGEWQTECCRGRSKAREEEMHRGSRVTDGWRRRWCHAELKCGGGVALEEALSVALQRNRERDREWFGEEESVCREKEKNH